MIRLHQSPEKSHNITITKNEVIKKLNSPELHFYKNHAHHFKGIAPDVIRLDEQNSTVTMRDVASGMGKPHLADIKIGTHFTNEYYLREVKGIPTENIQDKINKRRNRSLYTGFSEYNYCFAGYTGQDKSKGKHEWLREIYRISPKNVLASHFDSNAAAINKVLGKLAAIAKKLQTEPLKNYALVSSSVLIAFDKMNPENADVQIIDFINAIHLDQESSKEKQDAVEEFNAAYQKGLHNLMAHLKSLVDSNST